MEGVGRRSLKSVAREAWAMQWRACLLLPRMVRPCQTCAWYSVRENRAGFNCLRPRVDIDCWIPDGVMVVSDEEACG